MLAALDIGMLTLVAALLIARPRDAEGQPADGLRPHSGHASCRRRRPVAGWRFKPRRPAKQ